MIIVFLPKEEVYYFLEKKLEEKNVVISDEKINSGFNSIKLNKAKIYYKGLHTSNIDKLTFNTYLFFNQINIESIETSEYLNDTLPSNFKNIKLTYSLINFDEISIEIDEESFQIIGVYKIAKNKLNLELILKDDLKNIKSNKLIKYFSNVDGKYYYEYKF